MELTDSELLELLYEKERQLNKQLSATKTAIVAFGGKLTATHLTNGSTHLEGVVTMRYDTEATWKKKGMIIMGTIKTGYVSDMIEVAIRHEPGLPREMVRKRLTQAASVLYREGKLEAEKEGNKYKYSIKE